MTDLKVGGVTPGEIKQDFDIFMRLHDERDANTADLAEHCKGMKSRGHDVKAMKRCLVHARKDRAKAETEDAIFEVYREALGLD
ncbi:hypothetical protein GCM10019059_45370 [Camelimonas fluminis]|uniref:GapR family DNA-binding domain-containing protein n=1 Tax=Camelimonas fluminis TaxID=1576911 RepID=A0ABV7UB25_9HYPH|nr:GapR family DNA-binding domain-containing protein [Camelimonas fluminis]GHE83891.1 hypothetical protein GCM10019059_45370 [Camelimonas fluminis]